MKYSIVIPCYKSSQTIGKVVTLIMQELCKKEVEIILVNDDSPDDGKTFLKIKELANQYSNITAIDLAKNTGQHNAVMAGLNYASGDYIVAMDDDLQTHPSQLHKLMEEIEKGYDIVYAYYPDKKHKWYRNIGSYINSLTVRILIGKPKDLKTSSFWIIKKFVRDSVIQYKNSYAYIQGLFLQTTRNIKCVPVTHFERETGKSNYTLKALIKLWSNIIGFSVVPLRMASWLGGVFSLLSLIGVVFLIIRRLIMHTSVAGWASMMVAICFFSGVILMFMGLIGEYIGRMFLANNRRPQYVVRQVVKQDAKEMVTIEEERKVEKIS
jgi:glycosyltransferase involved in cell wall biosynthesis